MAKENTSITIESELLNKGQEQAKKERRSFSSFIEFLIDKYLKSTKN